MGIKFYAHNIPYIIDIHQNFDLTFDGVDRTTLWCNSKVKNVEKLMEETINFYKTH